MKTTEKRPSRARSTPSSTSGRRKTPGSPSPAKPKARRAPSRASRASANALAALEGSMTSWMMVDRDLVITFINDATRRLMREHEAVFKAAFPGFSVDTLLGSSIDQFHRHPEHQRSMLADPKNLPHTADIHVGPMRFRINTSAIIDDEGKHVGNALEWHDVTQQRKDEAEVEQLQQAVSQASTALMMVDANFVITYANESTKRLLRNREAEIRKHFPDFSVDTLIGTSIDVFHENPKHQHRMLADTDAMPRQSMIRVGPLSFRTNLSATFDRSGKRIGSTMEWNDVTEQVDVERQIEKLIKGAAAGRLEERLETDSWEGFLRKVGDGVNQLVDAVATPIRDTTRVAMALADGNLSQRVDVELQGDFERLGTAINSSIESLAMLVAQIQESSSTIAQGANELNEGNTNLSARTEEQAAALEETASTVEELTSTVKQNAASAGQANQLAADARDKAESGGQVVSQAVEAMAEINSASGKIADIIGVIDEIAFQTNLLALNAAVEAARAGEQGRGFAVVASEVRNLAQRSAGAAKEIKTLIRDSVAKVEDGSRLVDQSGATLKDIILHVKKVSDIIAEIAAASEEQANGIEQVNQAVSQMDQMTQQNAALVEQASAASASVDEQAQSLDQLVRRFELGEARSAPRPAAPAPKPKASPRSAGASKAHGKSKAPVAFAPQTGDDQEWQEF